MIRIIVEVTPPDASENIPGSYRTFDVICKEMEAFLVGNGLKGLLGYEIKETPPAAIVPVKKEEKPDPDALPKGATALETYKHKKALELKAAGKLPAKLKPDEPILEQYQRYTDAQKIESAKETAKNKGKGDKAEEEKRQAFNKRLKAAQAQWDAHSWVNTLRRIPRPTKESWKQLEAEADKAAA